MKYRTLTLEISAILASYLIMMLPVVSAYYYSLPLNPVSPEPEETEPQPDIFSILTSLLKVGLNKLIPSVQAAMCGDAYCESPAENMESCCYDCECSPNYYCHIETGADKTTGICRDARQISMTYRSISNTSFLGCNKPHKTNLTVSIENQPGGVSLDVKTWTLNHSQYSGQIAEPCAKGAYPNYYICPVTIPALPKCGEGEFTLENNTLAFNISFTDGRFTAKKGMSVYFPPVTLQSWDCGNVICEEDIGESISNCCLDCGCPPQAYCDIVSRTAPGPSACRTLLSDTDLSITNVSQRNFPTHKTTGDKVSFNLEIHNKPLSLEVSSPVCELSCTGAGEECEASCSVACPTPSIEPNASIYNTTCDLSFTVTDYNKANDYTLRPSINFTVKYNNGTRQITDVLGRNNAFVITISPSICGDGFCDTTYENKDNCCHDCIEACGGEFNGNGFCDISDEDKSYVDYNKGVCKDESLVKLTSAPITKYLNLSTILSTTYVAGLEVKTILTETTEAEVNVFITGRPRGLKNLAAGCAFSGWAERVPCMILEPCRTESSVYADTINLTCDMVVPQIPYKDVGSILNGHINFTLTYNDGPQEVQKVLTSDMFTIDVAVKPGCGNGVCETEQGECSGAEEEECEHVCCLDCPLPEGLVCIGTKEKNLPLDVGQLTISVPQAAGNILPLPCSLAALGGECSTSGATIFDVEVYYAGAEPPGDFEALQVLYELYDIDTSEIETKGGLTCELREFIEGTGIGGTGYVYECSVVLDPRPASEVPAPTYPDPTQHLNPTYASFQKGFRITLKASFTGPAGKVFLTPNTSILLGFQPSEIAGIGTCRDLYYGTGAFTGQESLQTQIVDAKDEADTFLDVGFAFGLLAIVAIIVAIVSAGTAAETWGTIAAVAGVIACIMWLMEGPYEDAISAAEGALNNWNNLCSSYSLGALQSGVNSFQTNMDDWQDESWTSFREWIRGIGCLIGIIAAWAAIGEYGLFYGHALPGVAGAWVGGAALTTGIIVEAGYSD